MADGPTIDSRVAKQLKGLKKADLKAVARSMNAMGVNSRSTNADIRRAISRSINQRAYQAAAITEAGNAQQWVSPKPKNQQPSPQRAGMRARSREILNLRKAVRAVKAGQTPPTLLSPTARNLEAVHDNNLKNVEKKLAAEEVKYKRAQEKEMRNRIRNVNRTADGMYIRAARADTYGNTAEAKQLRAEGDRLAQRAESMRKAAAEQAGKKYRAPSANRAALVRDFRRTNGYSPATTWSNEKLKQSIASGIESNKIAREHYVKGVRQRRIGRVVRTVTDPVKATGRGLKNTLGNRKLSIGLGGIVVANAYRDALRQGKSHSDATKEAAKAAVPVAAVAAAPAIAKGADKLASMSFRGAMKYMDIISDTFSFATPLVVATQPLVAAPAGVMAATSVAAKAVSVAAKVASRVALPAVAAYGAYHGFKQDGVRGAGRGILEALDPTELFMDRGLAERGFDAVFGRAQKPQQVGTAGQARMQKTSGNVRGYLNQAAANKALEAPTPAAPAMPAGGSRELLSASMTTYQTKDGRTVQATQAQIANYRQRRKS